MLHDSQEAFLQLQPVPLQCCLAFNARGQQIPHMISLHKRAIQ
jgi:hypothetical protein